MSRLPLALTESDANTIYFALSILPELNYGLSDAQQSINDSLCETCIDKINAQESNFSANEIRIIYCALGALNEVIRGEFEIDRDLISMCHQYMFNVNKLLPKFENMLPDSV